MWKTEIRLCSDNNDRWLWYMECTYFYFPKQFFLYIDSLKLSICTKVFVGSRSRIFWLIPHFYHNIIEPKFSPIESKSFWLEIHCQQISKKSYKSFHFSCKCTDCSGCLAENYAKYFEVTSLTILEDVLTRNCFVFFLNFFHNSESIVCLWPSAT